MDFVRSMIARDQETGKYGGSVVTRFPPEPNGYLHIGHAKAIHLNFEIAAEHPGGRCHLRLDDTNPETERSEYVEAMKRDIRWLGHDWGDHLYHASDYFGKLYECAVLLVRRGLAYVDSSTEEEIRARRGSVTEPGVESPWRGRPVTENLDLLERMRAGEFPDGSHVLRARIDMAHPNMVMRDPLLYRIRHSTHYRQGDGWPIYPMYDFAHCLSDSIERVTHSLCTLEFENNREIYDWLLAKVDAPLPRPEQTEFAPLVVEHVVTSKRRLKELVGAGAVRGWDDPRMPTIAGLRRRGVTPEAIRRFCEMVGVSRAQSRVDYGKLEFAIRDDLNRRAPRAFCILDPLRVVLTDFDPGRLESLRAPAMPGSDDSTRQDRDLSLRGEIYIERGDFAENPPPGFHRLRPGGEVRLKYALTIRCDEIVRDGGGRIVELRCSHDPETLGGVAPEGRRVPGTIHWLSAADALPAEVRLYDRLFAVPDPPLDDLPNALNPDSERIVPGLVEPGIAGAAPGTHYQFERLGYFFTDPADSRPDRLVLNRVVTLRDSWAERLRREESGTGRASVSAEADPARGVRTRGVDTGAARSPEASLASELERDRFRELRSLGVGEATAASLVRSPPALDLFHQAIASYPEGAGAVASWLVNDVARLVRHSATLALERLAPGALADLVRTVEAEDLSHRLGRRVLEALLEGGGDFEEVRLSLDLAEVDDEDTLRRVVEGIVAANPEKAAAYRAGRSGLLGFFVGEAMRATGGHADPRAVSRVAIEMLSAATRTSSR